MSVKQLKELIATAPDNMPVLIPGSDHSYRSCRAEITTALNPCWGTWNEDFGEDSTPEKEYGKRRDVLVIL
jgi:hypothetical protein